MRNRTRDESGFALIVVLWVLVILSVLVIGFGRRASLERRMAWYGLDHEQAQQAARGAAARAIEQLASRDMLERFHGQAGYTGLDQDWARPISLKGEARAIPYLSDPAYQDDYCEVWIEDCERRISVNHAPQPLLENLGILDFTRIRALMGRRVPPVEGARPHLFADLADFREVASLGDDVWYDAGAGDLFTVWGDPAGLINLNTAPRAVLLRVPGLDESSVDALMALRNGNDGLPYTADDAAFRSVDEAAARADLEPVMTSVLRTYCKTNSLYFVVHAQATRRRGQVMAECHAVVQVAGGSANVLQWKEGAYGA